jgi:hypothetical protein
MMRFIAIAAVLLCLTTVVSANQTVYAEIGYPSATTWGLYLTETDWQGTTVGLTPSGFGICAFSVDIYGTLPGSTANKKGPTTASNNLVIGTDETVDGWVIGPVSWAKAGSLNVAVDGNGYVQALAGQDTAGDPLCLARYIGATSTAGSFNPSPNFLSASASSYSAATYSWLAPGAPGSAASGSTGPGIYVFGGKRASGAAVTISPFEGKAQANIFTDGTTSNVSLVDMVFVPEPATITMLVLGGLGILRRRR